jgi:hypothetical protein
VFNHSLERLLCFISFLFGDGAFFFDERHGWFFTVDPSGLVFQFDGEIGLLEESIRVVVNFELRVFNASRVLIQFF